MSEMEARSWTFCSTEAVQIAAITFGDPKLSSSHLIIAHATGFCKEVYLHLVEDLRRLGYSAPITCLDFRGHGDSTTLAYEDLPYPSFPHATYQPPSNRTYVVEPLTPRSVGSLWLNATDLILLTHEIRRQAGRNDIKFDAFGHSMGAMLICCAQILSPGLFRRAVLVEPVIFPVNSLGRGTFPLVTIAAKRRPSFASQEEALENFKSKEVFRQWDSRCLNNYVKYGLVQKNGVYALKCTPEWESLTFKENETNGAWELIEKGLQFEYPPVLVCGKNTTTYPEKYRAILAKKLGAHLIEMPDADHFVPMTHPEATAKIIIDTFSNHTTPCL